MDMDKGIKKIVQATESILGAKTQIKRKKKTLSLQNKQTFTDLIHDVEVVINRENIMAAELKLDFSSHNDYFFNIIEKLLVLKYGKEVAELINFYLYDRMNPDGSMNGMTDRKGNDIILNSIDDLWNTIIKINPNIDTKK